jgi:DNA-binding transcriptional ArsR family regulator
MASSHALDLGLLKALGHPLRLQLVTLVTERGEASPIELARMLDQPLSTVSHHVRTLRDLGYLELTRTEPRRGAVEHYYRAATPAFLDDEQGEHCRWCCAGDWRLRPSDASLERPRAPVPGAASTPPAPTSPA